MEPRDELQIRNDENGKRETQSESRPPSIDKMLQGTGEQTRSVVADTQYPLGSRYPSSSCRIDADDRFIRERTVGSMGSSTEFYVLSHFLKRRAASLKGQDVITESHGTSKKFELHPTGWKPWSPSRNMYSIREGGLQEPFHQQRSMPEELLRLRNRGGWESVYPRRSGRTHLRSMSFPRGREKCADPCFTNTSLGSLTTVATSLSGTSVFSFFTRRHTDFTDFLRSAELGSFSEAATELDRSKMFRGTHAAVDDQPAGPADEHSFSKFHSHSISANATTPLPRVRPHSSADDKYSETPIQGLSESIHRSSGNFGRVASSARTSEPDCGRFPESSSGYSRRIPQSQLCAAEPSEANAMFGCTDTLPHSTTKSPWSFCSHSALTAYRDVTTSLSRDRPRGPGPTEVWTDRAFTVTEVDTSREESQLAVSTQQPCVNLRRELPLPCSRSSADRDAAVGKPFEKEQGGVPRTSDNACRKSSVDREGSCLTREFRLETPQEAEVRRCPNAPHLTYTSAPTTDIPELVLDRILMPPAVTERVLTVAKHAEGVDDREIDKLVPQPAGERLQEAGALEKVLPTPQSVAPESGLYQPVPIKYSGQLQQALSAIGSGADATLSSTGVTKHGAGGL